MKSITMLALATLLFALLGCSTKERTEKKHAMTDELEAVEKAKQSVELIEKQAEDQMKEIEKVMDK